MNRYQIFKKYIAILFFLGIASNILSPSEAGSRELVIVYSGNALGELKPCGCAKEEDQGGFERRSTYLKQVFAHSKNVLLVDTGDNFKEPSRQGKIKARYIMQAMSKAKYDAVVLGDKDLVYGVSFLENHPSFPWLLSNADFVKISPKKIRIKKLENGLSVAVIALIDPDLYYDTKHSGGNVVDPKESAQKIIKNIKTSKHIDIIVLLTHMRRDKALSMLQLSGVDVVINGHIEKDTDIIDMNHVESDGKIFAQPGPKGQKLGELTIQINDKGTKTFKQRIVRLDSNIKLDPEMLKWYEEYNKEVEDLFFASLESRKNKQEKTKVYASEQACLTCHPSKHKAWGMSRHSHAYETLSRINKAFDPECLQCHVTGWGHDGGFISEVDTPKLKNVQCEACHGPRFDHSKNLHQNFQFNAKKACKSCHVKNHSPNFNFSKYWEKIKH